MRFILSACALGFAFLAFPVTAQQGEMPPLEEQVVEENLSLEDEQEQSHSKTEDLHLYFKQSLSARVGKFGIFLILSLALALTLSFASLILSYTAFGREFLQSFVFRIF